MLDWHVPEKLYMELILPWDEGTKGALQAPLSPIPDRKLQKLQKSEEHSFLLSFRYRA